MQLAYQHPELCNRLVLVGSGGLGREVSWMLPLPWYVVISASLTGPTSVHSFVSEGERKDGFHIHPTWRLCS